MGTDKEIIQTRELIEHQTPKSQYGARLKELRIACNLTLDEVFEKTKIWKGTLSQIENGKMRVSIDLLHRLGVIYGGYDKVVSFVLLNSAGRK